MRRGNGPIVDIDLDPLDSGEHACEHREESRRDRKTDHSDQQATGASGEACAAPQAREDRRESVSAALGDDRLVIRSLDNCSVTVVDIVDGVVTLVEGGHEADTLIR